jgi:hypothetical protein
MVAPTWALFFSIEYFGGKFRLDWATAAHSKSVAFRIFRLVGACKTQFEIVGFFANYPPPFSSQLTCCKMDGQP